MIGLLLALAFAAPPSAARCGEAKLKQMTRDAEVVFVGEVIEVQAPGLLQNWSGVVAYKQFVRYNLRSVVKGEVSEGEVKVYYYIVHKSLTADKEVPQLSPELFKAQNLHVVFMRRDKNHAAAGAPRPDPPPYVAFDSDCGAVTATDETEALLRRILK